MGTEEHYGGDHVSNRAVPRRGSASAHGTQARREVIASDGAYPDAQLVSALRHRDEAAFTFLLDRYGASMMRIASACLRERDAVEDVVQEAWLGVLRGIDGFEARCSLKTWIFRILQNRIRTRLRRYYGHELLANIDELLERVEPAVSPDRFLEADHPRWPFHWKFAPTSWGESPEEVLLSGEARAKLESAVEQLPALQRVVITMRDIEGWPADEVCDVLGITPVNQRVLLHRARSRVRQALEDYFQSD